MRTLWSLVKALIALAAHLLAGDLAWHVGGSAGALLLMAFLVTWWLGVGLARGLSEGRLGPLRTLRDGTPLSGERHAP